jgi:hypothetical protein
VRTPVGLGQQECKGGAKKSNSEIWHNFQGFSFFEVKLKLIIDHLRNRLNFDLNKSRQKFHHSLKEHHKISNIPKFRC